METTLIATNVMKSPNRMAGSYQAAWRVTIGDKTGLVVHSFDYDKRDIENETVIAEASIAEAMRAEIDDEWWDPAGEGFYDDGRRIENQAALDAAIDAVTETLYKQG